MKKAQLFFLILVLFFVGSTWAKGRVLRKSKRPRRSIGLNELHSLGAQLITNDEFIGPFEEKLVKNSRERINSKNYPESTQKGKKKKNPTSKNKG